MSEASTRSARIRARLDHPIVDGDGHLTEFYPGFLEYVEKVGGGDFARRYLGGFGASASLRGLPDLNFLCLEEMAAAVERMARRISIPLIADGDTGYGGPPEVERCVRTAGSLVAAAPETKHQAN